MSLSRASTLLSKLSAQYEAGDVEGQETLAELKILLLESESECTSKEQDALQFQQISSQVLELGILLSAAEGDLDSFGRNMAQWKPYCAAVPHASATSSRKCHVLGLNLMYLLVDNRLSEFHAELELLTEQEAMDPLISFPIELERQLMVGLYDKVLTTTVPHPSFQFFIDSLLLTVRDGIADCMEVAYSTMKLQDAAKLMRYEDAPEQQVLEYIRESRDDWIIQQPQQQPQDKDTLILFQPPTTSVGNASDIPSMQWIAQSLTYATEMERIV